jgi:4-amino-4-deoxy-L-arabinose transferase-like glycosyltransferase
MQPAQAAETPGPRTPPEPRLIGFWQAIQHAGRADRILVALLLVINAIVLVNAILHDPKFTYDAGAHLDYMQVLHDRLPTPQDTPEYFSPPLPYLIPSLFDALCEHFEPADLQLPAGSYASRACRFYDGRLAQGINVLLSLAITLLLVVLAEQIRPGNRFFKITSLALFALPTVYYKTFSQARGEPYVLFFVTLTVYLVLKVLKTTTLNPRLTAAGGVVLGLLVLSRQWGFFIFPAILLLLVWILFAERRLFRLRAAQALLMIAIAAVVGGWYYIHLLLDYGTLTAFNIPSPRDPTPQELASFYRDLHISDGVLFERPIWPLLQRSYLPIMYSETWGDYEGFFTYVRDSALAPGSPGNRKTMAPYLGSVNLVSSLPSLILLGGLLFGLVQAVDVRGPVTFERETLTFLTLVAVCTVAGYTWFVTRYFMSSYTVVKATYVIQLFLALPILGAAFLERLRARNQTVYLVIMGLLALVWLYNLPAMITRYNLLLGY